MPSTSSGDNNEHDVSDEEIARKAQGGDAEAFGFLVDRYEKKLTRYGRKFLFGREDVKDLVQEVFLKAYTNIQSFDAKRRFSPWIYRIAHNEFINALKKKEREPIPFFDPETLFPHPIAKETAEGEVEKGEMRKMIDEMLHSISAKYREVIVLYYFEELGYEEIADILKIPASTVGVRLRRGKEAMRKAMATLREIPRFARNDN